MLVFINYWIEKCTVKHWNSAIITTVLYCRCAATGGRRYHFVGSTVLVVGEWMSVDHWWNDNDGEKPKYSEKKKTLSQCHFIRQISHMYRVASKIPGQSMRALLWTKWRNGTSFSPNTSVFLCHYHSISSPPAILLSQTLCNLSSWQRL